MMYANFPLHITISCLQKQNKQKISFQSIRYLLHGKNGIIKIIGNEKCDDVVIYQAQAMTIVANYVSINTKYPFSVLIHWHVTIRLMSSPASVSYSCYPMDSYPCYCYYLDYYCCLLAKQTFRISLEFWPLFHLIYSEFTAF